MPLAKSRVQFPLVGRIGRYLAGLFSSFLPVSPVPSGQYPMAVYQTEAEKEGKEREETKEFREMSVSVIYHSVIYPRAARHQP